MEPAQHSDRETYRAIVFGKSGSELLLKSAGDRFLLPSVEIPRWERVAENLNVAFRNEWRQEAVCLFELNISDRFTPSDHDKYQVMECCRLATPRSGAAWIPVSSLSERTFVNATDQLAVHRSLTQLSPGPLAPFARLGWFSELQEWIKEVIGPMGFHLTGRFSQLNASPSFSLVRFETSGPAVWFKGVGKPNLREFPITLALAKLVPQHIPRILAVRPEWNGWLASEVKGTNLGEMRDTHHWKSAASSLAKLQFEFVGKCETLLNSNAHDLRAPILLKLVRPFLNAMGQLMERQTKTPPAILPKCDLTLLGEQIEEALLLCSDLGIPDTLGHLDLNPGNVFLCEDHCIFLDWAEAYVGNPFFSFQYLVEHFRHMASIDRASQSSLTNSYLQEWLSFVLPESLQDAWALIPMLAAFTYGAATDAWCDQARLEEPKVAGYLRSLTRRIHREGRQLRDRGTRGSS